MPNPCFKAGKTNNIVTEMKRMNFNIIGVSEVRWPGWNYIDIDDYTNVGNNDFQHYNGAAVIIDTKLEDRMHQQNNRSTLLQEHQKPAKYDQKERKYWNGTKALRTSPGSDIGSDQNPVVGKLEIRLKKVDIRKQSRSELKKKWAEPETKEEIVQVLNR